MKAVRDLKILGTEPEERFDKITKKAMEEFDVPISTITIIDAEKEWFKSCQGLDYREAPREISFCGHAMYADKIFVIEDTLKDERFADNPYVKANPPIRFYAGIALYHNGSPVGVFCIKDYKPRNFRIGDITRFIELGREAEDELNMRP